MLQQKYKQIIRFMKENGEVTAKDLDIFLGVDHRTSLNALQNLERKNMVKRLLKKEDLTKGSWVHPPQKYFLTENATNNFEILMTKY